MTTFEKIQKSIADQLRIKDIAKITPSTDFKNDLHADSLDLAEMLMQLEENFSITIPTEKALSIKNVGEVVSLVESLAKVK